MTFLNVVFWISIAVIYFIPLIIVVVFFFNELIFKERKLQVIHLFMFIIYIFTAIIPLVNIIFIKEYDVIERIMGEDWVKNFQISVKKIINYTFFEW